MDRPADLRAEVPGPENAMLPRPHVTRTLLTLAMLGLLGLCAPDLQARGRTFADRQLASPRVAAAYAQRGIAVATAFLEAGAQWPPRDLLLRGFKGEAVLEVWSAPARGGRDEPGGLVLVWELPFCATSGLLGPKVREGDRQIPEGFYHVDRYNPHSSYHLSLGLDYPNAVDRARAGDAPPGGDIFVHGDCVTIGCLPLGDDAIEDLYLAAVFARDATSQSPRVHIYPCRFGEEQCEADLAEAAAARPELTEFWRQLRVAHRAFQVGHRSRRVVADKDGTYRMGGRRRR